MSTPVPEKCSNCIYFKPLPIREAKYNRWCIYHKASALEYYDTCRDKIAEGPVKRKKVSK